MEFSQIVLVLFVTILALYASTGEGLKCYVCNSAKIYEGKQCKDPFPEDKKFLVDCNVEDEGRNKTALGCRKQAQSVGDDYRIVRSCAYELPDESGCVERAGTKEIALTYCECKGEGCNGAQHVTTTITSVLGLAALSAVLALIVQS